MRSEEQAVDRLRRTHREASDALGDGPDAGVRAAVLAAAARGVDARPRLAATDGDPPSVAPSLRARRWPLSAAALLVVSVLTGLVATQAMRDRPERVAVIASSAPAPAMAAPSAPAPPTAALPEPSHEDKAASRSRATPQVALPATRPSPPKSTIARNESRSSGLPASTDRLAESPRPVAPPSPSQPAFEASVPAVAAAAPAREAPTTADASPRDADEVTAPEAARSGKPAPRDAARARIGRAAEPVTPEAWVERIATLRATGRDVEADRELDALRRRYPGFAIPASALRPEAGTR